MRNARILVLEPVAIMRTAGLSITMLSVGARTVISEIHFRVALYHRRLWSNPSSAKTLVTPILVGQMPFVRIEMVQDLVDAWKNSLVIRIRNVIRNVRRIMIVRWKRPVISPSVGILVLVFVGIRLFARFEVILRSVLVPRDSLEMLFRDVIEFVSSIFEFFAVIKIPCFLNISHDFHCS